MLYGCTQYNTAFWALVLRGGRKATEAQGDLKGSDAEFKNEMLFSRFGINYNNLPEQFKKVPVMLHDCVAFLSSLWSEDPHRAILG